MRHASDAASCTQTCGATLQTVLRWRARSNLLQPAVACSNTTYYHVNAQQSPSSSCVSRFGNDPMPIRIFIAVPHLLLGTVLHTWLDHVADFQTVDATDCGKTALQDVRKASPDVAVIGASFEKPPTTKIVRSITSSDVKTRVVVLSQISQAWMAEAMFDAGAAGYLMTSDTPEFVLEALRGAAAGQDGWISPQLSRQLLPGQTAVHDRLRQLTPRECDVLATLMQGQTNAEIAEALHVSTGTVKNHVHHILQKLDMSSRLKLIVWGYDHDVRTWLRLQKTRR